MKIVIKRSVAGRWPEYGGYAFHVGQVVAVPDGLAEDLIRAGHAEPATKVKKTPAKARKTAVKVKRG